MSRLGLLLENIKFEHTVFALPFAYLGMVLAAGGLPTLPQFLWVTVAMAGARTLAMNLNRLIDLEQDRRNPRTASRPLPRGALKVGEVALFAAVAAATLTFAAWQLNELTLKLLPLAVLLLAGYSYTKRFTWLCHWALGITDAAAPVGGWIAVAGAFAPQPFILGAAVACWIAGFDLVYATQDVDFDRRSGLHSLPARFGLGPALTTARAMHLLTLALLVWLGLAMGLGWPYWLGVAASAALLAYEHALVSPRDLSRVNLAFFNVNGYIALVMLAATVAGVFAAPKGLP